MKFFPIGDYFTFMALQTQKEVKRIFFGKIENFEKVSVENGLPEEVEYYECVFRD